MQTLKMRTALSHCALVILLLTVAACGGENSAGSALSTSKSEETPLEAKAEAAAAASAAATETVSPAIAMKVHGSAIQDGTDRFIVKYKDGSTERKDSNAIQTKLNRLASAFPAKGRHLRRMGIGADVVTSERKLTAAEARAFMRAIASDPNVEYVEPDVEMYAVSAPNDPLYPTQWHLQSKPAGIGIEGAWDNANGAGQVIAVVDTGVTSHSDYNANLLLPGAQIANTGTPDGMNSGAPGLSCVTWHGTHVAGIAAAQTNNGVGVAGVAPNAKILSVKVLGPCGNGAMSEVADGIVWAAGGVLPNKPINNNPATVINLSLASNNQCFDTLQNAIDYATSKGAVVVAAAGNNTQDVARYQPANCRNLISVGGTDGGGNSYVSSNFGPGIDISAPAMEIMSTYDLGTDTPRGDDYRFLSGTSMAAPMVSGVIALAQSAAPTPLTVAEFRTLLRQNAKPFPAPPDRALGAGILDATKTVAAAKSGGIPVAADFTCQQESAQSMWVLCKDLSTARGGLSIKTRKWDPGSSSAQPYFANPAEFNYKYSGAYPVTLTVTDSNGKTSSLSRSITVNPPPAVDLPLDTAVPFSGSYGYLVYYKTTVPPGAKSLTFSLNIKNSGEAASIYVNDSPSDMTPACAKAAPGPEQLSCTVKSPKPGLWYGRYFVSSSTLSGATAVATVD
ncbi:S8 family serine peptidase [Paraburkholderia sp. J7]|uniref:S8 family serine peptidase n=1 Tax=Paraburkholderia sp. J7 TaxID=2805438 RepID=UPI002AB69DC9|nr:S8 family serine peptidase [Paraburkholderia sp. J7]